MSEEISLYRKYRPQLFSHLVGQDHIRQTLVNALKKKQAAHAYLFCGPRGTGKTTTARLVAKSINCLNLDNNSEPCNSCEICTSIAEGRLIDIIEIDAASNRGIDEIRDLREKIKFAPTHAAKKVYIIDEVHMLTKEAFNALLKTLEEPPSHAHFILATTEAYKVPETIISRCQRFDFKRINQPTLIQRLEFIAKEEGITAEIEALELIAGSAQGGLRDAIGLFEQMIQASAVTFEHVKDYLGVSGMKTVETFLNLLIPNTNKEVSSSIEKTSENDSDPSIDIISKKDTAPSIDKTSGKIVESQISEERSFALEAIQFIHKLYQEGADLSQFHKECLERLRTRLLSAVHQKDEELTRRILELIELFLEIQDDLKNSPIPELPFEMLIVKSSLNQNTITNENPNRPNLNPSADRVHQPIQSRIIPNPTHTPNPAHMQAQIIKQDQVIKTTRVVTSAPYASSAPAISSASLYSESSPVSPTSLHTSPSKSSSQTSSLGLEHIRKLWPRVLDHVKTPSFRLSLAQGLLENFHESTLRLGFRSQFHLEKVKKVECAHELEMAIFDVFNQKFSVLFESISLEENVDEIQRPDFAKQAADFFGGELIEEVET